MKLLHLADLHIGKRVYEYSMLEEQKSALLQAFKMATEHEVDAVLIAGDVYDKNIPTIEGVKLFDTFLTALKQKNIPTFIISGNHDSAERLSFGAHPMFRLNDGTVWTFGREEMQDVVQITAVETTRLHAITEELRNHNLELAAMNLRLKKHAENVEEMTRAKERLEIKARIHSEFGKALLSTRRYLQDEEADAEEILNEWKRNIAMLRMKTVAPRDEDPMSILMKVASAAGITVELCGDMPEEESIRQLFFEAASEALTNAVAHAGATCLHIEVMREAERVSVRFTNDGMPPPDVIAEGGGLGALRQKTERIGGEMHVETANGFALTLSVLRKEVNRFV